jgi:signal transduction histidine kinase/ActR/RegA family two-component response regulator
VVAALLRRIRDWLTSSPATDALEQRHAVTVQLICLVGAAALLASEGVRLLTGLAGEAIPSVYMHVAGALVLLVGFVLLRRGRFQWSVRLLLGGIVAVSSIGVAWSGFAYNMPAIRDLAVPLAIAALLIGRRALWTTMCVYAVALFAAQLRDAGYLGGSGPLIAPLPPFGGAFDAVISLTILSLVLDRLGYTLRDGFTLALARQRELEHRAIELRTVNAALSEEMFRRQEVEAQLIAAQKMEAIARLSGGIAHDFNNLLTVIVGSAELSKMSIDAQHPIRENLDEIATAAQRAAELTGQLLAFARKQLVEPRVLSVTERILATEKMVRRLIGEDIELVCRPADETWCVRLDPGQFEQIILNLVVNARDAMSSGGRLSIGSENVVLQLPLASTHFDLGPGQYAVIVVADNGTGMDADTQSKIFEPFFTTKEKGKGTGLGLSTCYGIVKQAGGAIFCESAPGKGTKFRVYLPRTDRVSIDEIRRSSAPRSANNELLLVVEDEKELREMLARILRGLGYRVLLAGGAEQAISVAERCTDEIALLITDMVLPGGNGRELAEQIVRARPTLKVLFTSGYTDDAALRGALAIREVEFLAKPFTPASLADKVRAVLATGNSAAPAADSSTRAP